MLLEFWIFAARDAALRRRFAAINARLRKSLAESTERSARATGRSGPDDPELLVLCQVALGNGIALESFRDQLREERARNDHAPIDREVAPERADAPGQISGRHALLHPLLEHREEPRALLRQQLRTPKFPKGLHIQTQNVREQELRLLAGVGEAMAEVHGAGMEACHGEAHEICDSE